MTAKLINDNLGEPWAGIAKLYEVTPPIVYKENKSTNYIIVSATILGSFPIIETYIFPSDSKGNILDWSELDGSMKNTLDHEQVLEDAGYTIA